MPRWVWFTPIGLLALALGIWGFRLGWIVATISETDVIEGYTARYLQIYGAGAKATDCFGRPGASEPVWVTVICTAPDKRRFEYPVDRFGRLLTLEPTGGSAAAPKI